MGRGVVDLYSSRAGRVPPDFAPCGWISQTFARLLTTLVLPLSPPSVPLLGTG